MSRAAESPPDFIGVNWGSTNFRAYRITEQGRLVDEFTLPAGVTGLSRAEMAALAAETRTRWPDTGAFYASGMIGSNIGWHEAPYVMAPAGIAQVSRAAQTSAIGDVQVRIVPGICCRRAMDGGPDVLRGEEIELFGFARLNPGWSGLVALPGTHTKWVRFEDGCIQDFFTSMSGEIFDRLTQAGLLASIVQGPAVDGAAFVMGAKTGFKRQLGLGTLLFGARARVMQNQLDRRDAASYLRGLLIGAEIADAMAVHPGLQAAEVPLIGSGPVCELYASALRTVGVSTRYVDSKDVCIRGFLALHEAATPIVGTGPQAGMSEATQASDAHGTGT